MEKRRESLQSNNLLKRETLQETMHASNKLNTYLSQKQTTNQTGITLIALVVTIVVLLILAGITISLVFGQNGVIKKAQDSKEQTAIGEMREKLEMAKVPVYADGNGSYKVKDYWDRIESEGLIADKDADKIDNGDGTYEITTTPGYVFEITVEPDEEIADNIIIGECIGKGENLNIGLRVVNKTTNSIEIEVVRAEGASDFKYSIKKQGEEYGEAQASDDTTYTFNGLTQGGIYTIKVEATKDGEQQEVERTVQVGEIPRAIYGEVTWTGNGQAQVRIYTEETGYQLEWQKNGIDEGSWTRESTGVKEVTIPNLSYGDIIYARLYDGVSIGKYVNIEIADDIAPSKFDINVTEITNTGATITRNDSQDEQSGIQKYEFYIGERKVYEGMDNTFKVNDLEQGVLYQIYVIAYDNAGNYTECSERKSIKTQRIVHEWEKYSANIQTSYKSELVSSYTMQKHDERGYKSMSFDSETGTYSFSGSSYVNWGDDDSPSYCWTGSSTRAQRISKGSSYREMTISTYQAKKEEIKSCGSDYYGVITDLDENAYPINGESGGYWYIYKGSYTE